MVKVVSDQQGNSSMERVIFINGKELNLRTQSKIEIADVLRSDTAQMVKAYHGAFVDLFKEEDNGITLHFCYDYKTEDLSAL